VQEGDHSGPAHGESASRLSHLSSIGGRSPDKAHRALSDLFPRHAIYGHAGKHHSAIGERNTQSLPPMACGHHQ